MTAHCGDNQMPPLHQIWRIRVVLVVALSLSAVLFAPEIAQASCGSYVTLHSPAKNVTQTVDPQISFEQTLPAHDSGRPQPCSGPNCSSRPLIPPLPAVSSVRITGDEATCISAFTLTAETSSAPLAENLSAPLPLQLPRSIFHPPRLPRHSW